MSDDTGPYGRHISSHLEKNARSASVSARSSGSTPISSLRFRIRLSIVERYTHAIEGASNLDKSTSAVQGVRTKRDQLTGCGSYVENAA